VTALRPAAGLRSPATLLEAWDAARATPDLARGAVVLAATTDRDADELVDLPISELATLALRIQRDAYGDVLDVLMRCEGCDELLDVPLSLSDLLERGSPSAPLSLPRSVEHSVAGHVVEVRTPTTRDLMDASSADDPAALVLDRCVVVDRGALATQDLSDTLVASVEDILEQMAAPALSTLVAPCPECGERATGVLDPGELLWQAVDTRAPALLAEVAYLAAAFGWSQDAILALSPARRAAYLELAGA
jgi:hypothetical protein